jgi:hypothetical protein
MSGCGWRQGNERDELRRRACSDHSHPRGLQLLLGPAKCEDMGPQRSRHFGGSRDRRARYAQHRDQKGRSRPRPRRPWTVSKAAQHTRTTRDSGDCNDNRQRHNRNAAGPQGDPRANGSTSNLASPVARTRFQSEKPRRLPGSRSASQLCQSDPHLCESDPHRCRSVRTNADPVSARGRKELRPELVRYRRQWRSGAVTRARELL